MKALKPSRSTYSKILIVFLSLAAILYAGYLAHTHLMPFDARLLLPESHPERIAYDRYLQSYDDRQEIAMLVKTEFPLSEGTELFDLNIEIGKLLYPLPFLREFGRISSADYLWGDSEGIMLKPFFEDRQLTEAGKAQLTTEMFQHTFLSKTGHSFLVHMILAPGLEGDALKHAISSLHTAANKVASLRPGMSTHLLGFQIGQQYFVKEMVRNQQLVIPLTLFLIIALITILFRSVAASILSLYIICLGYVLMLSLIILREDGVSAYSGFALVFVFVIATADLVHYFTSLSRHSRLPLDDRLKAVKKDILRPCFLTTLTTAIGFLSLTFTDTMPVASLGWYCAAGSVGCFLLTFYWLPSVIRSFSPGIRLHKPVLGQELRRMPFFLRGGSKPAIVGLALVGGFLAYHSLNLKIEDSFYHKFVPSHPLSQTVDIFQEEFNVLSPVDIILDVKTPGGILPREGEKTLRELHQRLRGLTNVVHVRSAATFQDYVRSARQHLGPEATFEENTELGSILDLLVSFDFLDSYLSKDKKQIRIQVFLNSLSSQVLAQAYKDIRTELDRPHVAEAYSATIGGFSRLRQVITELVVSDLIRSFSLSFLAIFVIFAFVFRSIRAAALGMIPNTLPILAVAGAMGFFDVPIESNLVILVTIVLGLAVDDTIHFLTAFLGGAKSNLTAREAADRAMSKTATALIGTTLIFVLTIPAFFLMEIVLFVQIALFLIVAVTVALVADLVLLPPIVIAFSRSFGFESEEQRSRRLDVESDRQESGVAYAND